MAAEAITNIKRETIMDIARRITLLSKLLAGARPRFGDRAMDEFF